MEKKKDYLANRASLAQLLKQEPTTVTPLQEVRPVEPTKPDDTEKDVKISGFWGPPGLAKKLKVHAAESGKSIREISIEAYQLYFDQLNK